MFLIWSACPSCCNSVFTEILRFMALPIMSIVTRTRTVMVAPTKMTTRVGISSVYPELSVLVMTEISEPEPREWFSDGLASK